MSDSAQYLKDVAKDMRYFPVLISALIFGLLLLFFKDLSEPMKNYLIPSTAVYTLGSGLLAYIQSVAALRRELFLKGKGRSNEYTGNLRAVFLLMLFLQVGWFGGFVWYNFHRGVL